MDELEAELRQAFRWQMEQERKLIRSANRRLAAVAIAFVLAVVATAWVVIAAANP